MGLGTRPTQKQLLKKKKKKKKQDFHEQAKHIRDPQANSTLSLRPLNRHLAILKNILELQWSTGGSVKRMGNLSSAFEKANSQWEQTFKCRLESWQRTPINIIFPSMFHINRALSGKDDSSSVANLKNSKTSKGSCLDL